MPEVPAFGEDGSLEQEARQSIRNSQHPALGAPGFCLRVSIKGMVIILFPWNANSRFEDAATLTGTGWRLKRLGFPADSNFMRKRSRKKKLVGSASRTSGNHPALVFNFFQGCQNSCHPEWGPNISKFKIPGGTLNGKKV